MDYFQDSQLFSFQTLSPIKSLVFAISNHATRNILIYICLGTRVFLGYICKSRILRWQVYQSSVVESRNHLNHFKQKGIWHRVLGACKITEEAGRVSSTHQGMTQNNANKWTQLENSTFATTKKVGSQEANTVTI